MHRNVTASQDSEQRMYFIHTCFELCVKLGAREVGVDGMWKVGKSETPLCSPHRSPLTMEGGWAERARWMTSMVRLRGAPPGGRAEGRIIGRSRAHGPSCLVPVSTHVTSFAAGKFLAETPPSHAASQLFLAFPPQATSQGNAYSRTYSLSFIALVPWSWMLVSCVSVSVSVSHHRRCNR